MAKASHPGRTKTRLSPPLTPVQAAELNTVFVRDVAENLAGAAQHADIAGYIAYGPPGAAPFFEQHLSEDVGLVEAWLPNFGDCLHRTLESLFDLGYGAACVLNSDSPTLPTSVLVETARALQAPGDRLVLGPSTDGGYYLLGVKRPHRRLFEDVAWSTDRVLEQTRERAAELGLDTLLMPEWYDVDDAASLECLLRETLQGAGFCPTLRSHGAPHTAAFLRRSVREGSLPSLSASASRAPAPSPAAVSNS